MGELDTQDWHLIDNSINVYANRLLPTVLRLIDMYVNLVFKPDIAYRMKQKCISVLHGFISIVAIRGKIINKEIMVPITRVREEVDALGKHRVAGSQLKEK